MSSHENPLAAVTVGSLRIDVWFCEDRRDDNGGTRRAYGYRIADNDPTHTACERTDLESGVGSEIDVHAALSTLISFMTAAGEGYQYAMMNPSADPESMRMFPIWVSEAAYMNADELAILTLDSSDVLPRTSSTASPLTNDSSPRSEYSRPSTNGLTR
ncbi:hypothetical protein ABTX24_26150 [Nocardioides sp. NPDC127514]|uniref:hypothetical protein n=1 Tax=unclassified Nocardioides TaxID=2615069 RepID=UPI00332A3726